jgi:hypothetical protein
MRALVSGWSSGISTSSKAMPVSAMASQTRSDHDE